MSELWDAYDRFFQRIEGQTLIRGKRVPDGVFHLVGEIIVRHRDGSFLLMQRDLTKPRGGLWELTAGGSALKGETPSDCAVRELWEETGIAADTLTELDRIVREDDHTLYVEFLCITDCDKTSVRLQKGETAAFRWVSREELLSMDRSLSASPRAWQYIQTKI